MSLEEWTTKRAIRDRADILHSLPLMKDVPSFQNPLYNGPSTVNDPLYLGRGQLDRLSYLRTDRTLEVPPEALKVWQDGISDTGPARLSFASFQQLMSTVGIPDGHDELFFGRRLVLEPGGTHNSRTNVATGSWTTSLDSTTSTNSILQVQSQQRLPTSFDPPTSNNLPASPDIEWILGWSPE